MTSFVQVTDSAPTPIIRPMSTNYRDVLCVSKLQVAVPPGLLDAARAAARERGLTFADYVRGAVQGRMTMDGVRFHPVSPLSGGTLLPSNPACRPAAGSRD